MRGTLLELLLVACIGCASLDVYEDAEKAMLINLGFVSNVMHYVTSIHFLLSIRRTIFAYPPFAFKERPHFAKFKRRTQRQQRM